MAYKVHKYQVGWAIDYISLEGFLNNLRGEVISIIPNMIPKFHLMGATATLDNLLIIEKTEE
jgi:hypothetical protein